MWMPKLTISPSKLHSAPKTSLLPPTSCIKGTCTPQSPGQFSDDLCVDRATERIGGTPGEIESKAHYIDCVRGGWWHTPRNF